MSLDVSNLGSFLVSSIKSNDLVLQGTNGNDLVIKADPNAGSSYSLSLPPADGLTGQVLTAISGGETAWQNPTGGNGFALSSNTSLGANNDGRVLVKNGNTDDRTVRITIPRFVEKNGTGFDIADLNISGNVIKHYTGSGNIDTQLQPGYKFRFINITNQEKASITDTGVISAESLKIADSQTIGSVSSPQSIRLDPTSIGLNVSTIVNSKLNMVGTVKATWGNSDNLCIYRTNDSIIQSNLGNLLIDNKSIINKTIARLGTNTTATSFRIEDVNSDMLFEIFGDGTITSKNPLGSGSSANTGNWLFNGNQAGTSSHPNLVELSSGPSPLVTINGDLTVTGTTTSGTTATVSNNFFHVADNNVSNIVDMGWYGQYQNSAQNVKYVGQFWDVSSQRFKMFYDTESIPSTTVDTNGIGYTTATIEANIISPNDSTVVGTLTAGNIKLNGGTNIGLSADADLLQLSSGFLTINGGVNINGNSQFNSGELLFTNGSNLQLSDNSILSLGNSDQFTAVHSNGNTTLTSTSGNLTVQNTNSSGITCIKLGSSNGSGSSKFQIKNSLGQSIWEIDDIGSITSSGSSSGSGSASVGSWLFDNTKAGIAGTADMINLAGGVVTVNVPVNVKNNLTVSDNTSSTPAFVVNIDPSNPFTATGYDKFFQFYENPVVTSPVGLTYSANQLTGGIIIRQGGTTVTDTIPTAANIITALGNVVHRGLLVHIKNENTGNLTINSNIGILDFSGTVIGPSVTVCFLLRQSNSSNVTLHCLHRSGA